MVVDVAVRSRNRGGRILNIVKKFICDSTVFGDAFIDSCYLNVYQEFLFTLTHKPSISFIRFYIGGVCTF